MGGKVCCPGVRLICRIRLGTKHLQTASDSASGNSAFGSVTDGHRSLKVKVKLRISERILAVRYFHVQRGISVCDKQKGCDLIQQQPI